MAVMVTQQIAATEEQYNAVNELMETEANPPPGLILHTGGPIGDGELRVVDVWESAEAFQSFAGERLGPAVQEIMGADTPPPSVEIVELYDVIKGVA